MSTATTFDESYYLSNNADVVLAISQGHFTSGLQHYQLHGGKSELRDPNATFDASYYAAQNSDVLSAVSQGLIANVFAHYQALGEAENRAPSASLSGFTASAYLEANTDVAAAITAGSFTSALDHFIQFGQSEARSGSGVTASSGTTFTLTTGTDTLTGTAAGDTFDASGFFNSGTATTVPVLGSADRLDGGAGTDTINILLTANSTVTPASMANIEVVNLTSTTNATPTLNLTNATGVTTIGALNSTVATQVTNLQSAATAFNMTNTNQNFTVTAVNTALAGTSDAATLTLDGVTGGTVTIQTTTAASGYETLSVVSGGSSANTLTALTDGTGTSLATINVSGAQNINLGTTLDATVLTVNAADLTGALTVVQTNAVKTTITGGSGNDTIDVSSAFVDGSDSTNVDIINGGDGTDSLTLTSAEVAAVTAAAQWTAAVSNVETVVMDTVVAADLRLDFLTGVTTVEFDGGIGAQSHRVNSGTEIQYDLLDADNDAQTFTVSGSATTDTLTIDINGVDIGNGTQTYIGIETLNIATSGTSLIDGAHVMDTSAATQTMNITGTGTLTLGNITADAVDASGMSGTLTVGTLQAATNFTGGSGVDTVVGSTAADIIIGGAGADFLTNTATGANVSAGDTMTGGAGFDTFTLIGDSASAANYNGSTNITDFTVGSTAATTDFIRFTEANTDYGAGAGLSSQATGAAATGTVGVQNVAQSAGAAAVSAGAEFFKLTTGVAFDTNLQTTFNNAIGTSTITGTGATSLYAGSYYDTTNNKMVILNILNTATTNTTIESGDTVSLVGTIDMTAADYALIDADNFASFLA